MTLLNAVRCPDAIYLATDSGVFTEDGRLHHLFPKVMEIPGMPAAIALAGKGLGIAHIWQALHLRGGVWTEGRLRGEIMDVVRDAYRVADMDPDVCPVLVVVALWSAETSCAHAAGFVTSGNVDVPEGIGAWKFWPITCALMPDVDIGADFEPSAGMMSVVDRQRAPEAWEGGPSFVSGEIRLTKVSAEGVRHAIMHEYSDIIGQKVSH